MYKILQWNKDDGENIVVTGVATSEEASWAMRRGLEETFGAEPGSSEVTSLPTGSGSTSTFGFGNWAGSTWEPEGPKPNWRVNPPKDPHVN